MLTNIIFILIALILLFVLYLAVKAITRGVEAKMILILITKLMKIVPQICQMKLLKLKNFMMTVY